MCATAPCDCASTTPAATTVESTGRKRSNSTDVVPPTCDCRPKKTSDDDSSSRPPSSPRLRADILARCVAQQRTALEIVQFWRNRALTSPTIRSVCESSQLAHLLATGAVLLVCSVVYPSTGTTGGSLELSSSSSPAAASSSSSSRGAPPHYISLIYLVSTALHFGSQFWMTFVSGLTLYFSLSRHAFGDVQQVLFPRYFTINSLLSSLSLLSFARLHCHLGDWTTRVYCQVFLLSATFLLESLSRLYVSPRVISSMIEVRRLELEVDGVGKEVGRHLPRSLASSPPYVQAYSYFRKQHGLMAVANLLSISCSTAHLCYLATAINFT